MTTRNGTNKLSEDNVIEIFQKKGRARQYAIAQMYGVTRKNVRSIHNGITWGWLTALYRTQQASE